MKEPLQIDRRGLILFYETQYFQLDKISIKEFEKFSCFADKIRQ
jgi:hypothetical protein